MMARNIQARNDAAEMWTVTTHLQDSRQVLMVLWVRLLTRLVLLRLMPASRDCDLKTVWLGAD